MTTMERVYAIDQMGEIASDLADFVKDCDTITFTGPLGAGKTTLIRALVARWGLARGVTSPTFTYMQRYKLPNGKSVYHFDLYRLSSKDSFLELGLGEYLTQGESKVLVEWPAIIRDIVQGSVCAVTIEYGPEGLGSRRLTAAKENR